MTVTDLSSCFEDEKFFPPGFRFHPTDEELVLYYLKRKMCRRRLKLDIIGETDIYKCDPEELPGLSKLKTGDRQWFFFSPRDRKYPNAARSNRATLHGYWKATGKDRQISCNSRSVGVKKTLVFYSGRAPSGVRTDWVMHEYTLDEEELKRCHSVKDYYALYKVYKKSGPGPKNGEQYGAPFKEEDWADDECLDSNAVVNESNDVILVENNKADNDIDEFLKRIADEELVLDPQPFVLNQIVSQEEAQSTMESGIKFYEGPEVTNMLDQLGTQLIEEDFLENFLEMDDLTCSDLNVQNLKDPVDNSLVNEFNGLSEAELCQDLTLLGEVGPAGPGESLVNEFNGLSEAELCQNLTLLGEVGPGDTLQMCLHNQDEVSFPYKINSSGENYLLNGELDAVSHSYLNSTTENELHYQMLIQDQNCNIFTSTESNQGVIPSNSGEVYDCNPANHSNHSNQTQNGIGNVDENNDPWFSSALWSWLESMPTDTASAAESPIANRTCFRRGISSNQSQNDTVGAAPKRLARSKSLFLSFLILGVICALLSVLIRTSMVSGRYNY